MVYGGNKVCRNKPESNLARFPMSYEPDTSILIEHCSARAAGYARIEEAHYRLRNKPSKYPTVVTPCSFALSHALGAASIASAMPDITLFSESDSVGGRITGSRQVGQG